MEYNHVRNGKENSQNGFKWSSSENARARRHHVSNHFKKCCKSHTEWKFETWKIWVHVTAKKKKRCFQKKKIGSQWSKTRFICRQGYGVSFLVMLVGYFSLMIFKKGDFTNNVLHLKWSRICKRIICCFIKTMHQLHYRDAQK